MEFAVLSDAFEKMERTSKRLELIDILVSLFRQTPSELISKIVYLIQGKLRPEYEGVELGVAEKLAIRAIAKSSAMPARDIQEAYRRDGDLGHAAAKVLQQKAQTTFMVQDITVERVYDTLYRISQSEGARSQDMKIKYISSLLNDANPQESSFILKILLGTLRLGIAENTVMDALAIAYTGSKENRDRLESAYNVSSDLGMVAQSVAEGGIDATDRFGVRLYSPVRPMLADRVRSEADAVEKMGGSFAAEYKLDGERVQLHIRGDKVVLFSRSLENITRYYPDIVERVPPRLTAGEAILEAEAVAVNEATGRFLPFQELMHRRRKYNIDRAVINYPISVNLFDVLLSDGTDCIGKGYAERRQILADIIDEDEFVRLVPMETISDQAGLSEFLESSINAGCEGLMLKRLDAPYRAGTRGSYWLKLKREYQNELGDSLDLVVVGAFFGKGRRTGRYGTLLLATYNDDDDTFRSICKVGTGFTDESLDRLYQTLSDRVTLKRNARIDSGIDADVWFEPGLVIEVVASEITQSPIHKTAWGQVKKGTGLALRFPKFTGKFREEKTAEDASTDQEVVALYRGQTKIDGDAT